MHARREQRRQRDNHVDRGLGMGMLLRLAVLLFADRWLIAAVPAIAAAAISAQCRQAGKAGGSQGSRAPGCPLLLHQRLKAL